VEEEQKKIRKKDILTEIEMMIEGLEKLPPHVMYSPVLYSDHCSILVLLAASLRADLDS
jgi:hypothetical protein